MPIRVLPFDLTEKADEIPKLLLEELITNIDDEADIEHIKVIRHKRGSINYVIEDGTLMPINENNKSKNSWQYPPDFRDVLCLESFELRLESFEVYINSQLERPHQPHRGDISRRGKAMYWRFTEWGMRNNLKQKVVDSKKEKNFRDDKLTTIIEKGHYPGSKKYESRKNEFMKAWNEYEMNLNKINQFDAENKKNPRAQADPFYR